MLNPFAQDLHKFAQNKQIAKQNIDKVYWINKLIYNKMTIYLSNIKNSSILPYKQRVGGSNPSAPQKKSRYKRDFFHLCPSHTFCFQPNSTNSTSAVPDHPLNPGFKNIWPIIRDLQQVPRIGYWCILKNLKKSKTPPNESAKSRNGNPEKWSNSCWLEHSSSGWEHPDFTSGGSGVRTPPEVNSGQVCSHT